MEEWQGAVGPTLNLDLKKVVPVGGGEMGTVFFARDVLFVLGGELTTRPDNGYGMIPKMIF